jgi:hypothetical protein
MSQITDFIDNWDQFRAQFGNELRWGGCIALMLAISAVMHSNDSQPHQMQPEPQRNPMELIASPNDPLMIEAIKIARAPTSNDGPWGAAPVRRGPTATFQSPGGPVTLTRDEIANANSIYPQLKSNPAILRGATSNGPSAPSGGFSDDLSGDWQLLRNPPVAPTHWLNRMAKTTL